jgi:transposase InsO family protein
VTGIERNQRPKITDAAGVRRAQVGWDAVHIAIDDATRLAYAEVLADEGVSTAIAFLGRALAFFTRHGFRVERVLTDNGAPCISAAHALACRQHGLKHLRTRPYRPHTDGKAERFIRILLDGWAYGPIHASSRERTAALDGWLWHDNHRRPHQAIGRHPPIHRLNNLLGTYT